MRDTCLTCVCHNITSLGYQHDVTKAKQVKVFIYSPCVTSRRVQLPPLLLTGDSAKASIDRGISADFSRVFQITLYVRDGLNYTRVSSVFSRCEICVSVAFRVTANLSILSASS